MTNVNKWVNTLVHTEDYKEGSITVTHYSDGTKKDDGTARGSYSYELHSPNFPHSEPISAGRGLSVTDCVKQAKKAHKSFWGPQGVRRI